MYKFYQEQPENSWASHPIRGEKGGEDEKQPVDKTSCIGL